MGKDRYGMKIQSPKFELATKLELARIEEIAEKWKRKYRRLKKRHEHMDYKLFALFRDTMQMSVRYAEEMNEALVEMEGLLATKKKKT